MKLEVSKENIEQVIEHCKFITIKNEMQKVNKIETGSLPGNIKISYGEDQNIVLNYLKDTIVYFTKENSIKNETMDKKKFNKPLVQDPNDMERKIPCPKSLNKSEETKLIQNSEEEENNNKKQKKEEDNEYSEQKINIYIHGIACLIKESAQFFVLDTTKMNKKEKIDYLHNKLNNCLKVMKSIKYILKDENIKLDEKSKFIILEKVGFEYFLKDNENNKEYIYNFDKKIEGLEKSLRTWSRVKNKVNIENKHEFYYQYIINNARKVIENDLCINNIYNLIGHVIVNFEEKLDKELKEKNK